MPETLFISDLHLSAERPEIVSLAADFLRNRASRCDALYILGDLFEYWIGDDQPTDGLAPVLDALASIDTPIYFIAGNRDFLLGHDFADRYSLTLLPEQTTVDLYGQPTLLLHGDTLCTDDVRYQQLRQMLRDPNWQRQFLSLPLAERIEQARALREQSAMETGKKAEAIMDVNPQAVADAMRAAGVRRMIHGHTHRPAIHDLTIDGEPARRIVLGDWYDRGSVLVCDETGCRLETIGA